MRLIDKFKKWFFNETKVDIINIADLIQIPGRDYFNEQDKLDLIDKYKEEYLRLLSQRRRLTTKDISCENLLNRNKMYTDLILRLIKRDNFYDIVNQTLLDNKIMILKLKLYSDEIDKIIDETIERLVALSELEKGRRVPHLNRDTIRNQISNLKISLQTLISQKIAIKNEIESYIIHISISDNRILPSIIEKRRDKTIAYASHIIKPKDLFTDEELSDYNIYKQMSIIAILETEMEKELYINKPDIDITSLIEKANSIASVSDITYKPKVSIKKVLLVELNLLENELMVYYLFGKNLISNEDWYKFYSAKFKLLTFDIADNYDDIELWKELFVRSNSLERKVYADIINKKIMNIFSTDRLYLIKYPCLERKDGVSIKERYLAKLLSNCIKEDNPRYELVDEDNNFSYIDALRLLLSLDSENMFIRLMNRKVNIQSLPKNACFDELKKRPGEGQFVFDDTIPLYTVLEVMSDENTQNYYKCLKEIYKATKKRINPYFVMSDYEKYPIDQDIYSRIPEEVEFKDVYFLPEGIKEIDGHLEPYDYYAEKVIRESKDKVVIMPNSLIEINRGKFFYPDYIKGVVLNNGIESIGSASKLKPHSDTFDIPSSLVECNLAGIDYSNIKKLRFKDYSNSKILRDPEQLARLLYGSLICRTQNYRNKRTIPDWPYANIRVDVDVRAMPHHLESIILEENGSDIGEIKLDSIQYYTTLKDMKTKDETYKADSKLTSNYAKKLCALLTERIESEKKKKEEKVKSKKKV